MQFRRKRPGQGRSSSKALSLASVAALAVAALLLWDEGRYLQQSTETPAVRSSSPRRVGGAAAAVGQDLPPPCPAVRVAASSTASLDGSRITILADWEVPAGWSDRESFASSFGRHGQYVKGSDVQPFRDGKTGGKCGTSTDGLVRAMSALSAKRGDGGDGGGEVLFFTNDVENPSFLSDLSRHYAIPPPVSSLPAFADAPKTFRVFSTMESGSSHPLHAHGAAWLGQASGSRLWYFLPPGTPRSRWGPRVNACGYASGAAAPPEGAASCVQRAGEVVYVPRGWVHATCALDGWSVGVGGQVGSPAAYDQNFEVLSPVEEEEYDSDARVEKEMRKMIDCGVLDERDVADYLDRNGVVASEDGATQRQGDRGNVESVGVAKNPPVDSAAKDEGSDWRWFDGNLNEYYNSLERDEHGKRDPNVISSYAVHRWLGPDASTLVHYELVRGEIYWRILGKTLRDDDGGSEVGLRVFDAG